MKVCTFCDRPHHSITTYYGDGNICPSCRMRLYRQDPQNFKVCYICKCLKPSAGTPNGQHLCVTCFARSKSSCKICGVLGTYKRGKCEYCFLTNAQITKNCLKCNESYLVYSKKEHGLCPKCSRKEYIEYYKNSSREEECVYCKKLKKVARRLADGKSCCENCNKKFHSEHKTCPRCKKNNYLSYNFLYQAPVCGVCDSDLRAGYKNRYCKSCGRKYPVEEMGLEVFCPSCR